MSYYKTINGKKMDATLLDQAQLSVDGKGDGRISTEDAVSLLNLVKDGNKFTDIERETLAYIQTSFQWTPAALEWFRKELDVWQSKAVLKPMTLAELAKQHFTTLDVLSTEKARAARKHALEAATQETNQDHDEIGLWIRLRDGSTVEVFSNFIDLEGDFVELRGGCLVPVKAIEKVEI